MSLMSLILVGPAPKPPLVCLPGCVAVVVIFFFFWFVVIEGGPPVQMSHVEGILRG